MRLRKTVAGLWALAATALTLIATPPAHADPPQPSDPPTLVMVSSPTTGNVMSAIAANINAQQGGNVLAVYSAAPAGDVITTRPTNQNCTFTRPATTQDALDALAATTTGTPFAGGGSADAVISPDMTGCVDAANSDLLDLTGPFPGICP